MARRWTLPGGVPFDADTRILFEYHSLNALEVMMNPIGAVTVLLLAFRRRRWLKQHARRESAAVWRRDLAAQDSTR